MAGDLHEVVQVWLLGNLEGDAFAMPGCGWRRRQKMYGID